MHPLRLVGRAVLFVLHLAALVALLASVVLVGSGCTHPHRTTDGGGERPPTRHPAEAFYCADCHPGACPGGRLDQRSLSERSGREAREAGDAGASAMQRNEVPGPCSQAEPSRLPGQAPNREHCRCTCWSGATIAQDCVRE